MRGLLRFICIIIIPFVVSGCNGKGADPLFEIVFKQNEVSVHVPELELQQQNVTIAVVPKVVNIPYFNAVEEGVFEAAKDLNVNVIYTGPPLADPNQQIHIIRELIDKEVSVIAVSANDPEKLGPVLLEARQKGIHVITWDADTIPEAREYFINMVEPETLGRHLMDMLAWNTNEEGEFAVMTGSLAAANLNEWLEWIKIQQNEYYPQMELVEIVANNDDPHEAYVLAKKLLETYPDLRGIIGNSSVGPPASAQAVKEAGKSGEVSVVGLSPPNQMNEHLKNGSAQIVTLWSPKKLGYLTVALAKGTVEGNRPFDRQDIPKIGKIRMVDDMVIMGEPIDFTKENVDQYDF